VDTFAASLLLNGGERSLVSILLSDATTKITERHGTGWIKARHERLAADLRRVCS
jgi:hypothetical protein